jgi:hypothetical protein
MSRLGYTVMCMCIVYNETSGVQRNNARVLLSSQHSAAVGEDGWRNGPRALDAY